MATFVLDPGLRARHRKPSAEPHRLPLEQECALARAFQEGDRLAGERLIAANLRYVIGIAHEYRRWGIPLDDLIQQGSLGLLHAARRFDKAQGASLRTYAAYWIRAEIRDYVVRGYRIVRLGTTRTERRALRAYRSSPVPDVESLAALSGMPLARCKLLWAVISQRDRSLEAPTRDGLVPKDLVRDEREGPEAQAARNEERARLALRVQDALSELSEREQLIVRSRLMSDEPETLEGIGEKLGVSRERVRQLESRARQKIHDRLAASEPSEPSQVPCPWPPELSAVRSRC
jgi:RNA polymerase sigma-32 factor